MAKVSKAATGTTHVNVISPRFIKILFQLFPGVQGTDAQRGIAGVPYSFKVGDGAVVDGQKTTADGGVLLLVVSDAVITLTIFDTDYLINVKSSIEPWNTTKGVQRRLSLLGYEIGGIDGQIGGWTDWALLNFQAESDLNADGRIDANTQNQLKKDFGE